MAGDFETFRGTVRVNADSANSSTLIFHANLQPKGRTPAWIMRGVTRRFLASALEAVCTKSEQN